MCVLSELGYKSKEAGMGVKGTYIMIILHINLWLV